MYIPDQPYRLIRKLGRGTFGEVWLADKHSALATVRVAVKFLIGEVDIEAVQRGSALWSRALGHPGIVQIIEADVYGDHVLIASEFVDGGPFKDGIKDGPYTMEFAVKTAAAILEGVGHLHKVGIVHRDLKPANIPPIFCRKTTYTELPTSGFLGFSVPAVPE